MSAAARAAYAPERHTLREAERGAPGLLPPEDSDGHLAYLDAYGPRPLGGHAVIDMIEQSGLAGRGGAGFPTARKLRAVREGRRAPVVLANGTEGEPASYKDEVLMWRNPHLVIDGALIAAETVRASRVILGVGRGGTAGASLTRALGERPDSSHVELAEMPERFVAGEESALVHHINGGEAKPTSRRTRPFEKGVDGRRTLVQNVETLANLALIARRGATWFRSNGTTAEPGSALVTVGGAVASPGVLEAAFGTPLLDIFERCGGLSHAVQAYLVGGYFGGWVQPDPKLRLSHESLVAAGGTLGARIVIPLAADRCGVAETARVVSYMAAQGAQQCGPCVFGLRTLATRLDAIARCAPDSLQAYEHLHALHRQIAGRGACAHPDGVLRLAASATRVFAAEFREHLAGRCTARSHQPVLPTPDSEEGWR